MTFAKPCVAALALLLVSAVHARQTITFNVPVEVRNLPGNFRDVKVNCSVWPRVPGAGSSMQAIGSGKADVPVDGNGNFVGKVTMRIEVDSLPDEAGYRCSIEQGTGGTRLADHAKRNGFSPQPGTTPVDQVTGTVLPQVKAAEGVRNDTPPLKAKR